MVHATITNRVPGCRGLRRGGGRGTRSLVIALAAAAALSCGGDAREGLPSLHSEDPLAQAIDRAAVFLDRGELRSDDAWVAYQAAILLGGEYEAWAATLKPSGAYMPLWELRDLEPARIRDAPGPEPGPGASGGSRMSTDDVLLLVELVKWSRDCPSLDPRGLERLRRVLGRPLHSYLLTHQLWGANLAVSRGCFEAEEMRGTILALAQRVRDELATDWLTTDLAAERIAMLCWVGLTDWVPDEKFDMLLSDQHPSGSWGVVEFDVYPGAVVRAEHTAALAFYGLAARWRQGERSE